jgi:hypothetical protein
MQLVADRIGWGVPSTFDGTVHSLFRNVVILAVPRQRLVTLAPSVAGGLPGAISVGLPADFDFRMSLRLRSEAAVRGGVLRFERGVVAIDLREARPWRSRLAELELDLTMVRPRRAWEIAAATLSADRRSDALAAIARRPIRALIDAASALDAAAARRAMVSLVGLGAGGTPAGDDFLVGFFSGLWATKYPNRAIRPDFLSTLGNDLQPLLGRTNDVSQVYLAAAAAGEASERLTALSAAIARGDPASTVRETAIAAIAVGHTSGADGTLGLLLGTAVWGPEAIVGDAVSLIDGSRVRVEA